MESKLIKGKAMDFESPGGGLRGMKHGGKAPGGRMHRRLSSRDSENASKKPGL